MMPSECTVTSLHGTIYSTFVPSSFRVFDIKFITFFYKPCPRELRNSSIFSRIPTVKSNFCYIQVIVFDHSYVPVAAVGT